MRRLKTDVDLSIPPKKEVYVYAPLTEKQEVFYKSTIDKTIFEVINKKEVSSSFNIFLTSYWRPMRYVFWCLGIVWRKQYLILLLTISIYFCRKKRKHHLNSQLLVVWKENLLRKSVIKKKISPKILTWTNWFEKLKNLNKSIFFSSLIFISFDILFTIRFSKVCY